MVTTLGRCARSSVGDCEGLGHCDCYEDDGEECCYCGEVPRGAD